jgi:hypothetical protein
MRDVNCLVHGACRQCLRVLPRAPDVAKRFLVFLGHTNCGIWVGDELCWAREYLQWLFIDGPKIIDRNSASAASWRGRNIEASCSWKMQQQVSLKNRDEASARTLVWPHLETLVARPLPTIWSSHTRTSSSQVLGLILRYPVPSFARCEVALAKMSQQSRTRP